MWVLYALGVALITSISAIVAKRVMRDINEYLYLFVLGFLTIPFLFLIVFYFFQIPQFSDKFILIIGVNIILGAIAAVLAYKAIRISDVSLVAPIAAFNPVFTTIISYFILHELIGLTGLVGIILVCIGAYILQIQQIKTGLLAPVKTLFTHRGVQMSLIAYFIWSITPILEKSAIFETSPNVPPFVSLAGSIGTTLIFGALSIKSINKNSILKIKASISLILFVALLWSLASAAAMVSFSLTNLGFAVALFKLSIVFTVILGWLFFKEKNIKDRLVGSLVMLTGVYLLVS